LSKIQPDQETRASLAYILSSCLSGRTDNTLYMFVGSGANGKSVLMDLMKLTLGDYFKPMSSRVLTKGYRADRVMGDKKGVRGCLVNEFNDKIYCRFMKSLVGGDSITSINSCDYMFYFRPQFKLFLTCNSLPTIDSDDEGTLRRICVIPFLSKFIDANKVTYQQSNFFIKDPKISDKFNNWRQMFMGMLISWHCETRVVKNIEFSELIRRSTTHYCTQIRQLAADKKNEKSNARQVIYNNEQKMSTSKCTMITLAEHIMKTMDPHIKYYDSNNAKNWYVYRKDLHRWTKTTMWAIQENIFSHAIYQYCFSHGINITPGVEKNTMLRISQKYDHEFIEKLDANPNIIGFNNGVYDVKSQQFRPGQPDDYITISVEHDFVPHDQHPHENENVIKLLSMLPIHKKFREYFYTCLSDSLSRGNIAKSESDNMSGPESESDDDDMPGLEAVSIDDDIVELKKYQGRTVCPIGESDNMSGPESESEDDDMPGLEEVSINDDIVELKNYQDRIDCRTGKMPMLMKPIFKSSTNYAIEQKSESNINGHNLPKLVDAHGKIICENKAELAVMMFDETDSMIDITRIYLNRFQTITAYVDDFDTELSFKNGIYVEVPADKKDIHKIRCHMLVKHQTKMIMIDLQQFCNLYA